MKLLIDQPDRLLADQGSQVSTRLLGGWFVSPTKLPKRTVIDFRETAGGIQVNVTIGETLGLGLLDPYFKGRYEDYFRGFMEGIRLALGSSS